MMALHVYQTVHQTIYPKLQYYPQWVVIRLKAVTLFGRNVAVFHALQIVEFAETPMSCMDIVAG